MGGRGGGEGMQRQDKRRHWTGGKERRDKSRKTRQFTAIRGDGQCGAGFSRQKAAKSSRKDRFLTNFCPVIFFKIVRLKRFKCLNTCYTQKKCGTCFHVALLPPPPPPPPPPLPPPPSQNNVPFLNVCGYYLTLLSTHMLFFIGLGLWDHKVACDAR